MTSRIKLDHKKTNIYIDTNVLWNYCKKRPAEVACLNALFKRKKKEHLFTSTFAIGQTMAGIQKSKTRKTGLTKEDTIKEGKKLCHKMTVLHFTEQDIQDGFMKDGNDVEDNIHFAISQKMNCNVIITNDFDGFSELGVEIVKPEELGYMKAILQLKK